MHYPRKKILLTAIILLLIGGSWAIGYFTGVEIATKKTPPEPKTTVQEQDILPQLPEDIEALNENVDIPPEPILPQIPDLFDEER